MLVAPQKNPSNFVNNLNMYIKHHAHIMHTSCRHHLHNMPTSCVFFLGTYPSNLADPSTQHAHIMHATCKRHATHPHTTHHIYIMSIGSTVIRHVYIMLVAPQKNPPILSKIYTCTLNIMHTSCTHHADIIYTTCQHHAFFLWAPTPQIWQTHPHNMHTSCTQHAHVMSALPTQHIIIITLCF